MPNEYLDKVNLNGTTYDIKDTVSGYVANVKVNGTSVVSNGEANLVTNTAYDAVSNKIATMSDVGSAGGGTVTSVGVQNGGGLTVSGSPITSSGTITVGHSNSVTAQTTQAIYPVTIDNNGHIASYGNAVTIPSVNNGALKLKKDSGSASSIYTANQSEDSTLTYTTSSVGSASGWSAGSAPTLGAAIPADDITSWTTNTPTSIDTTKFSGGSFTSGSFTGGSFTQGVDNFTANTPTAIDTTKFNGGSFSRGAFNGGSFTQGSDNFTAATLTPSLLSSTATADNPTTLVLSFSGGSFTQGVDNFTAATHGNDSFTAASISNGFYTAGTAASFTQGSDSYTAATHGNDSFTAASLSSGFYTAGSPAVLDYTSKSIPNVTNVGTTPSLTITDTTVVTNLNAS